MEALLNGTANTTTGLVAEILSPAPRPLNKNIQAELLFVSGDYVFHWRDETGEHFRSLAAASVKSAFSLEMFDSGWLPSMVRRYGCGKRGEWLAGFMPPARRTMHIYFDDGLRDLDILMPGFIFAGVGDPGTFYLWATDATEWNPEAQVFHAPLPNLYGDGHVCFGANKVPPANAHTFEAVWDLFWNAPFSEHLTQGHSQAYPSDCRKMLAQVDAAGIAYPINDLIPFTDTASQAVSVERIVQAYIVER